MNERYVLHHDGTWFYYLTPPRAPFGEVNSGEFRADGEPMILTRDNWWATDHEAKVITYHARLRPLTTGYRLKDASAESEMFPAELTSQEYHDRSGEDDDVMWRLYDPVTQEREPETTEIEGPWLRLDGEPPPSDGHRWTASLPSVLANHPEYLHLFPGYIIGFREHMKKVLQKLPRVRYVLDLKHGTQVYGLEVHLEIPFDQPLTEYRPALNLDGSVSRSRKGRTVAKTATRKLSLGIPYRIDGPDRATAVAEWDRREAEAIAAVEAASVAACSACGGHGYVPTGTGASQ